jgi:RNA:NAD 2'-phosphotransferase (TPT1/KptA family)
MINKGVDQNLVTNQAEKIKDDEHPVRLSKMISFALRHNVSKPEIVEAISDIEGDYVASTLSKVRKFLRNKIEDGTETSIQMCDKDVECDVIYEGGCTKCKQCGKSGC